MKSSFPIPYSTCLRILKKTDGYEQHKMNPKKKHNKKYHTPEAQGYKWLIDVKFVPTECKTPGLEGRFYQYTFLDETTRKGTSISRTSIPCTKASSAWRRQSSFSATPPKLSKRTRDPNSPTGAVIVIFLQCAPSLISKSYSIRSDNQGQFFTASIQIMR